MPKVTQLDCGSLEFKPMRILTGMGLGGEGRAHSRHARGDRKNENKSMEKKQECI